ncbi:hypothetical protein CONLIGDRAFT_208274 [Coniochaeta ligniaria NRRL 30616]|uniref:Uncharacterized protein n=1 Tax=Coniochaeta ligniaria NRRL 30616 TaxID=1408157 RepID=A0A1J7J3M7_9PEZI|nr:hypothetical protein CONLIGDRAFT_208274 [Coniochaeta ligniaria NRRL 30616]
MQTCHGRSVFRDPCHRHWLYSGLRGTGGARRRPFRAGGYTSALSLWPRKVKPARRWGKTTGISLPESHLTAARGVVDRRSTFGTNFLRYSRTLLGTWYWPELADCSQSRVFPTITSSKHLRRHYHIFGFSLLSLNTATRRARRRAVASS